MQMNQKRNWNCPESESAGQSGKKKLKSDFSKKAEGTEIKRLSSSKSFVEKLVIKSSLKYTL